MSKEIAGGHSRRKPQAEAPENESLRGCKGLTQIVGKQYNGRTLVQPTQKYGTYHSCIVPTGWLREMNSAQPDRDIVGRSGVGSSFKINRNCFEKIKPLSGANDGHP